MHTLPDALLSAAVILVSLCCVSLCSQVVARTPSRSYTVSQQMQLLEDIGDQQAVSLLCATSVVAVFARQ